MTTRHGRIALLLALLVLVAGVSSTSMPGGLALAQAAPPSAFQPAAAPAAAADEAAGQPASAFRRPAKGGRVAAEAGAPQASLWGRWQRWITDIQHDFSNRLTAAVRVLKEGSPLQALLSLASVSFLYGIAHAVGPGHGKAVITSYMFANERTLRRGIALAVASSFMQAVTAVAVITLFAVVLNATGLKIQAYADYLEAASYVLVALVGAWLVWSQLRKLLPALGPVSAIAGGQGHDAHDHHAHGAHDHGHHHHDHEHGPGCSCGHNHIPAPEQLTDDRWSWREAASIILAIGLRPCSGALIVLVFAYVNGLYWAGIASTFAMAVGTAITISALAVLAVGSKQLALQIYGEESRQSHLIVNGIALAGGLLVLVLGVTLFLGALGPARPFG